MALSRGALPALGPPRSVWDRVRVRTATARAGLGSPARLYKNVRRGAGGLLLAGTQDASWCRQDASWCRQGQDQRMLAVLMRLSPLAEVMRLYM